MTIWILVLGLLTSVAALGYRQGAVRVGFSLVGILVGLCLALPLSPWLKPALSWLGLEHPLLTALLPPILVFWLINGMFKVMAFQVHRKVDVHYKYHVVDLKRILFERLNARLGACLGLVNGFLYSLLVCLGIYTAGYWTTQVSSGENDRWALRWFNRLARDLDASRLHRAACALDPLPKAYYDAADFVGLIYQNPMLEPRLVRYPGLLELFERDEFRAFSQDASWSQLRQARSSVHELMAHPALDALLNNHDLLRELWTALEPDLSDLTGYLETGHSAKYDREPILGVWAFDFRTAFQLYRKANPRMTALQMREARKHLSSIFLNTSLVAAPSGYAALKQYPLTRSPRPGESGPGTEHRNLTGRWRFENGQYILQFRHEGQDLEWPVEVTPQSLQIPNANPPLAFERDAI
ncbi:MAG: CvpA family protein [Verrucomicrobiota bacterium]|nr:CvpA family protein [Limisphaera sp.]MDW8382161.1 CvpA family protein [Verrucomicrobiota bacterium]